MRGLALGFVLLLFVSFVDGTHEQWPVAGGVDVQSGTRLVGASTSSLFKSFVPFPQKFSSAPRVSISNLVSNDSTASFTSNVLTINTDGFTYEVIRFNPETGWDFEVHFDWVASYQGPCMNHDQCPDSQYCDQYQGCDVCAVCLKLRDSLDGTEECPAKCTQAPLPCRMCPELKVACGDTCVSAVGNEYEFCSSSPGCAVDYGPGSTQIYGNNFDNLTRENAIEKKANFAISNALVLLDEHLVSLKLSIISNQVISIANETLSCVYVTCPLPDQCHRNTTCLHGQCLPHPNKVDGTTCDDGNSLTDLDQCTAGVCAGVDLCVVNNVTCPQPDQCHESVTCANGVCPSLPNKADGTACDDGDALTDFDECLAGVCAGVDLCAVNNVVCPQPDQCHEPVTCANGLCPSHPNKINGTACDDGDSLTDLDQCTAGVCAGVDLCVVNNVTCPQPDQCHLSVTCANGVCPPLPNKADGTACDDGNSENDYDKCTAGICAGVNLCATVDCGKPDQCHLPVNCSHGHCPNFPRKTNGSPCDDGAEATDNDICLDGVCKGTDFCLTTVCPTPDQCHGPSTCSHGNCSPNPALPDGTVCNDGLNTTLDDSCQNEICVGIDYCVQNNVVCTLPDQCHLPVTCFQGLCPDHPNKPDGTACNDGILATDNDVCTNGQCSGVDLCSTTTCQPLDQCHVKGLCFRGNCTNPKKPDNTSCDDGDSTTDFDHCYDGVCVGLFQPTLGPGKSTFNQTDGMTYVSSFVLGVNGLSAQDAAAFAALFASLLDRGLPGIYSEDISIVLSGSGTSRRDTSLFFNISITLNPFANTTAFNEAINNLLLDPVFFDALQSAFPTMTSLDQIGALVVALRCLTETQCPTLSCEVGETPYQSEYLTVRACCAKCVAKKDVYSLESQAYLQAVQHFQVATQQQNESYYARDYPVYLAEKADYDNSYSAWKQSVLLWDAQFQNYTVYEGRYFDQEC